MKIIILGTLLLWYGSAIAKPAKPSVDKVLEYFQTEPFLGSVQKCMDEALARRKKEITITDVQMQNLTNLSHRIYPASNLYKTFKLAYAKTTTIENLTAVNTWMNSVKGMKFRRGLAAAYKATPAAREAYHKKMSPILLKPNRQNAINTFITNWEQDGLDAVLKSECDLGALMGMNGYQPAASRDQFKYLKEKVVAKRPGFIDKARADLMVFDFYVLKELKNADIDEVSKFATSAVGQGHAKAYGKALEMTMDGAAKTFMDQVSKPSK